MSSSELVRVGIQIICEHLIEVLKEELKRSRKNYREDVDVGGLDPLEDPESYRNHLRMSENQFEELYEKVKSKIEKQNTIMREALPSRLKLQITLRYLATGDTYGTLEALYRVPRCSIGRFVPEVCKAIWEVLEEYIKVSRTNLLNNIYLVHSLT
ncbi:hypothetical protein NQ314_006152 [Rhamnusium bicolor]|uniref:Uncharacterized protein n=1 Tax=Rhamnusium bicolor TaxID=1586634 RepID=A0AAV8Z914_9CUCU|nr:hypothetical protein NQ314_006152 [Rhamnusium bicolor]